VGVAVHQSRGDQLAPGLDNLVDRAAEGVPDEDDSIVLQHDLAVLEQTVLSGLKADDLSSVDA